MLGKVIPPVVAEVYPVFPIAVVIIRMSSNALVLAEHTMIVVILDEVFLHRGTDHCLTLSSISVEDKWLCYRQHHGTGGSVIIATAEEDDSILVVFPIWKRTLLIVITRPQKLCLIIVPADASFFEGIFWAPASFLCDAIGAFGPFESNSIITLVSFDTILNCDSFTAIIDSKATGYATRHISVFS